MMNTHSRISRLQELLELEERRASLQNEIETITQSMHSLRDSLFDASQPTSTPARASQPSPAPAAPAPRREIPAAAPRGRKTRMQRGVLKDMILSALTTAGDAGVRVKELAKEFSMKPVNIHSWFHSALNRHPEIKKLKGGHYRLHGARSNGAAPKAPAPVSVQSATTKRRGRPAKAAATGSGVGKSQNRRGELSARIVSELQSAGARGINVRDLSAKLGAPYKNIYIWFATTGKKNKRVKKLGPAHYKLS